MKASLKRRISIASCWAASRIALLDSVERYEDSYCISQEFCEWITRRNNHPKELQSTILYVPNFITPQNTAKFMIDVFS